jgi:DNA-binding beta-propeller fold protein YncE
VLLAEAGRHSLARTARNRYNIRFYCNHSNQNFFFGVPMSFRRVGGMAAIALAAWLELSCGQVYRPVVIPVGITPPNPANFHAVFGISANVPFSPGTALQIDVSGDTEIGQANMGVDPTHAAILPNNSRVFVASAGSLFQGDTDVVTAFFPAADSSVATGFGTTTTFTYPNIGPTNPSTNQPYTCSYLPDFVATSQNTSVFVANYGVENGPNCNFTSTDSVAALNPAQNSISNIGYLPAASHPVAMVETPDALNLYVLNQGSNTVIDLSPQDLSTLATIPVGNTPAWATVRPDSRRVYVLTQGDGQLYTISTETNAVISGSPQSVGGAGANFVLYDKILNRLYVTNPTAGSVYVFDATTDPPTPMATLSIPAPPIAAPVSTVCASSACTYSSVMPISVAALPDGTRFYVASYVTGAATSSSATTCPDANATAPAGCIIPQLTVFDAGTLTVKTTIFPLMPPVATASGPTIYPFALTPVSFCAPVFPYTPASARFRMSAAAAGDSSRVYTSMCDGGSVAVVATATNTIAVGVNSTDVLVNDLFAPFSGAAPQPNGEPLPQSPVFLLTGQ